MAGQGFYLAAMLARKASGDRGARRAQCAVRYGALFFGLLLAACAGDNRTGGPAPVVLKDGGGTAAPSGPAADRAGNRTAAPGVRTTRVRAGETLYAVARRSGVSLRALIDANRLSPPYTLVPDQVLTVPVPSQYVVRQGDTIYGISRRFGVDSRTLVRLNAIRPPYVIRVGQKLKLPGSGGGDPSRAVASASVPTERAPSPASQSAEAESRPQASERAQPTPTRRRPAVRVTRPLTPPPRASRRFLWPVRGTVLVGFGPQGKGLHNDGINIAVAAGAGIRAAENGVVAYAGNELRGFGNLLLIKHAGGWTSAYAHNRELLVQRGDRVSRGQVIARAGNTGGVSRPQLHFELRRGRRAVDPMRYLAIAGLSPRAHPIFAQAVPPNPE